MIAGVIVYSRTVPGVGASYAVVGPLVSLCPKLPLCRVEVVSLEHFLVSGSDIG